MEGAEGGEQVGGGADGGFASVSAGQNLPDPQQTPQSLPADPGSEPQGEHGASSILHLTCPNNHKHPPHPPQKQQSVQLRESLTKAQNALQSCDHQLSQLRAQSEEAFRQLMDWQLVRDR